MQYCGENPHVQLLDSCLFLQRSFDLSQIHLCISDLHFIVSSMHTHLWSCVILQSSGLS